MCITLLRCFELIKALYIFLMQKILYASSVQLCGKEATTEGAPSFSKREQEG
jgi:hypothetical protein